MLHTFAEDSLRGVSPEVAGFAMLGASAEFLNGLRLGEKPGRRRSVQLATAFGCERSVAGTQAH